MKVATKAPAIPSAVVSRNPEGRLGPGANKSPHRTIVVGDTPYDAETAAKAGLRTIGLLCGGWSDDELRWSGCIAVFKDPAELLARYAQSPLCGAR
jgi:phosphoglycolate phosphatase-like HAD superfamily hydrolase